MEFRKERNFIVVYDGVIKMGAWNISDGSFIGKSGKPVKTVPSCFTYKNLTSYYNDRNNSISDLYSYVIRKFREWQGWLPHPYTAQNGQRMEQLISVGLYPSSFSDLDNTDALTKEVVEYIKEKSGACFRSYLVADYLAEKQYIGYLKDKPDWVKTVFRASIAADIPYDYLKTFLNRMVNEHVRNYIGGDSACVTFVRRYYQICMALYNKAEIRPNLLSNYAHLLYLEEEYKNQHYNEELNKNNNKPWLYYQNDNFIVRPLLTKDEFHAEATAQNNCVERMYMERVYNGSTHVVTVRRVDAPDKSYITCEVTNDGRIWQYLIKNNWSPREQDAIDFKRIYQDYLNEAIKE